MGYHKHLTNQTTMKNTESQLSRVKEHLLKGYGISPLFALNRFGCFRLAARISDFKRDHGMIIETEMVEYNNKRFARYKIA